jgi:hypothetical protein
MILLIMNFCVVTSFIFIVYKKIYFFSHYMLIYIFLFINIFFNFFSYESGWVDMILHKLKFHERSEKQWIQNLILI